jgi:SAM-dependent methyltransferase
MKKTFVDFSERSNRSAFEKTQQAMNYNLTKDLLGSEGAFEEFSAARLKGYMFRWREALNHFNAGRLLDIGGGYTFEPVLSEVLERGHEYWYLDIDEQAMRESAAIGEKYGCAAERYSSGSNDVLKFDSEFFDSVFSSHCLEHFPDLSSTFAEINRVLKMGGVLCFAEPIGFDHSNEHIYVLDSDDWLHICELHGFELISTHVGKGYADWGFDLFVALRKVGEPEGTFDSSEYNKSKYSFFSHDSGVFEYSGSVDQTEFCSIVHGDHSAAIWRHEERPHMIICRRHPWSGQVAVSGTV